MRHLVTGGSGFIGNLVARRLRDRGETVRVLDVWSDPTRPADIEYIEGSVTDRAVVATAMHDVDIVHHHAALVAQSDAGEGYRAVNVEGSGIVAQEAVRAQVRAIMHVSSTAVYGHPPSGAITATTHAVPFEPYGKSKLAGEAVMHAFCDPAGIPLTTIRPRVTLGAGRLGIFEILFEWISQHRRVYISGDGTNPLQFVHVDDLIDFYMLALDAKQPGTFNVGAQRFGTLREDLEQLIRHAGSRSRVTGIPAPLIRASLGMLYHLGASPLVPWHYRTYHRPCFFDIEPLLAMGWRPRYSNADMLRESYDWYMEHHVSDAGQSAHRSSLRHGVLDIVRRFS